MGFIFSFKVRIASLAFLFGAVIPATSFSIATSLMTSTWVNIACGLLNLISVCAAFFFIWILTLRTSPYQSVKKCLLHLVVSFATRLKARSVMPKFLDSLKRPSHYQERLLLDTIRANESTVYGKVHGFVGMKCAADFRSRHPLTKYEHFRSYVQRVMDGEDNILTKANTTSFSRTSGTTGQPKYIPHLNRLDVLRDVSAITTAALKDAVPELGPLQKRLQFYVSPVLSRTKSGLPIETVLTIPAENALVTSVFSTPPAGFKIKTLFEANYIALLFALRDKSIGAITCNFLPFIERMMHQLEQCWKDIVQDIEKGTINASLQLDAGIRDELERELKGQGDSARAIELRAEFEKGFHSIIPRIWPRVKIIIGVDPKDVRARLAKTYSGNILCYSHVIGASEGLIAVNPWPQDQDLGYVPSFLHNFYEFIPEADTDELQPATLLPEELEVGQQYEIVVTTNTGLCRYRMGDVIKVKRFEHKTPVFEFSYRKGQMMNLFYEKLDQSVISSAIKAAVQQWSDFELYEYSVAESTLITLVEEKATPFYIFFIGMKGSVPSCITDEEKRMIDGELRARNNDFERLQNDGTIGPSKVYIVGPRAFQTIQEHSVNKGGASEIQYKVPNKLVKKELVELMMEHTLECDSSRSTSERDEWEGRGY